MPDDDHAPPPQEPGDRIDAALTALFAGPSPVNMIHGAIELGDGVVPRPSNASIAARATTCSPRSGARAGSQERSMTTIVDFTTAVAV